MATLPDISQHLHIKEGFCHPDWTAISEIIEKSLPETEWNLAWEAASRNWIERIRDYELHDFVGGAHARYQRRVQII